MKIYRNPNNRGKVISEVPEQAESEETLSEMGILQKIDERGKKLIGCERVVPPVDWKNVRLISNIYSQTNIFRPTKQR